ncbi:acetolactate decarboxylase [Subtercola sp. PAMC28395]|uniref:acetolactate decarboxylase n=1 Tax=Subtercola sp. PAMC28395 TaxID=2846775 RepID=UPI001C0E37E2|nr:acetolactate decarboxylase [Subtercola sp. PAMC28395]QWT23000.1 acetolactate decarboxylase [Subtercola sp. PAMC28395]
MPVVSGAPGTLDAPGAMAAAGHLQPAIGVSITQFSVIHALMSGLYDGVFPASQVLAAGGFGIGCGHALNGELVFVDGEIFRCTSDGSVSRVDESERVPFAEVSVFAPTLSTPLGGSGPLDRTGFESLVASLLPSRNLFYAIRVDGDFDRMLVREPIRQHHPFRPLLEVMQTQNENELGRTSGSLVGFWAPSIYQGISVAGFHLHYLDEGRSVGGHSLDYAISSGTLTMQAMSSLTVRLPHTPEFGAADFESIDDDLAIRRVEQSR